MKKLFSTVAVALTVLATFCNQASANDIKLQEDSLAHYFGTMWGNNISAELNNSQRTKDFNKTTILEGMKVSLTNDTTRQDFIQGLQIGMQFNTIAKQMHADSIFLDLDKTFSTFETTLKGNTANDAKEMETKALGCLNKIKELNGQDKAKAANEIKIQTDSMAYYFGKMWGNGVKTSLSQSPATQKFNQDNILKGIKAVLNKNEEFSLGVQCGIQLNGVAKQMAGDDVYLDLEKVYTAFKAAATSEVPCDNKAVEEKAMSLFNAVKLAKLEQSPTAVGNKKAGEEYIKGQMAKDSAFKRTESGLAYKVIKEGKGELVKATDRVKVKYVGKHIDGKEFDNSGDETREFTPTDLVEGFKEGLLMMNEGARYVLLIPGELGYGIIGQPYAEIEANETLVFEVEVVEIVK